MTAFTQAVVSKIKEIPQGRVSTYGDIAASVGNPRSARQIVWVLRTQSSRHELPWHRVISRKGRISIKDPEGSFLQRRMLEEEGIPVGEDGSISLDEFGYIPSNSVPDDRY